MHESQLKPGQYYLSDIPRIDRTHKVEWCGWLVSEKYEGKQGYGELKSKDGFFCCLGVYCEEAGVPNELGEVVRIDFTETGPNKTTRDEAYWFGNKERGVFTGRRSSTMIPEAFAIPLANREELDQGCREWSDFTGDAPIFVCSTQDGSSGYWTLPHLNDCKKFSFAQIADIINYFL